MVLNIYDLDRDLNKGDFGLHQKRTIIGLGLGLWCLMLLSTIFQLHRGGTIVNDILAISCWPV
jgi:hypothetical protein